MKPDSIGKVIQDDGIEYTYRSYFVSPFPDFENMKPKQSLGFILNDDNELLMTSQDGEFWELPGGTIELNEPPRKTLAREVYEETAIEIDEDSVIDFFYSTVHKYIEGKEVFHALQLRFVAKVKKIDEFVSDPGGEHKFRKFIKPDEFSITFGWRDGYNFLQNKLIDFIATYNL